MQFLNTPFYKTVLVAVVVVMFSCARQSAPTGGPKDEDPPVPLRSKPVNYSTSFSGDRFVVEFNEFVVLKNIRQELLVSPPLPEKPEVKLRGKNVIVKINNTLKDSTTYNFNFYDALSDLTENNPLTNFQFEFSTGPVFDSIYLGGILRDAFTYGMEKGLYVMLFESFVDSTPRKTAPALVAKTDEKGMFAVTNMKNQPYHLFALKDLNNNMKFDLPNEAIAFSDSVYLPGFKEIEVADSITFISSISKDRKDTVYTDTVIYRKEMVTTIDNIQLFLFTEEYGQQYFKDLYRPEEKQVILSFNKPVDSAFSVIPLVDTLYEESWFVKEKMEKNDSLVFWITDSTLFNRDSLMLQIQYTLKDSNLIDYIKTDTLLAFFEKKEEPGTKPKEEKKEGRFNLNIFNQKEETQKADSGPKPSELTFNTNAKAPFELNKPIELVAKFPVKWIQDKEIQLFKIEDDSIKKPVKFNFMQDSMQIRRFVIDFEKGEEERYQLLVPTGVFTDVYQNINDTLTYDFNTRGLDYYSKLTLHLKKVNGPSVLMVLDEKEKMIEEHKIHGDTTVIISYLVPKKYILKLYNDANENGKWDTGSLEKKRQPEKVYYFPKALETKSNWDLEFDWEMVPVTPPHLIKEKKGKTNEAGKKQPGNSKTN